MSDEVVEFEGFSNFDTWEAYNIICEDESIYSEIQIIALENNIRYFRVVVVEALKQYYDRYNFDAGIRVDAHLINYTELKRAFAGTT